MILWRPLETGWKLDAFGEVWHCWIVISTIMWCCKPMAGEMRDQALQSFLKVKKGLCYWNIKNWFEKLCSGWTKGNQGSQGGCDCRHKGSLWLLSQRHRLSAHCSWTAPKALSMSQKLQPRAKELKRRGWRCQTQLVCTHLWLGIGSVCPFWLHRTGIFAGWLIATKAPSLFPSPSFHYPPLG